MAARDDAEGRSGRSARPDKDSHDLTTQLAFLEEEVAMLRRKLADSPRHVRQLEERLNEAQANLSGVVNQNERLVVTLKEAREQIVALKEEVDRLAQPPSGYGYFLAAHDDGTIDVLLWNGTMNAELMCGDPRLERRVTLTVSALPEANYEVAIARVDERHSNVLAGYPEVREVAVVGRPSERWGEEVTAVVVSDDAVDGERLRAYAAERLAPYKVPKRVEFIDELPRNAMGKVTKGALTRGV